MNYHYLLHKNDILIMILLIYMKQNVLEIVMLMQIERFL